MRTAKKSSGKGTPVPDPLRATNDPLVSCPIVCGECMRASGFFYQTESNIHLVTARHNLLPTRVSIPNPKTNGQLAAYSMEENHSTIDVYLASQDGWESKRIDVEATLNTSLNQEFNLDIVALRIEFDPESYGYRVWAPESITDSCEKGDELMTVGFDGASFPQSTEQYTRQQYRKSIGMPRFVPFENSMKYAPDVETSDIGIGLDATAAGNYLGLSGAPVLGDGLVGIHTADAAFPNDILAQLELSHARKLTYFSASCLKRLMPSTDK